MGATTVPTDDAGRWRALGLLAAAMVLSMATWFSATAVVPQLRAAYDLGDTGASWLTIAVQLGFVVGAVGSALTGLSDRVPPLRVMVAGAVGAGAVNLLLLVAPTAAVLLLARGMTGVALALVYPPGMKAMATWFRHDRGLALGVMVGALTLGSALPHLVNGLGGLDVDLVVVVTSGLSFAGALLARAVAEGPHRFPTAPVRPGRALAVLRHRPTRLATVGYVGHMWELYALWAWVAVFLASSFDRAGVTADAAAPLAAFAVVGVGAVGCVVGGLLADRRGRARLARVSLASSGTAAVAAGAVWGGPPLLVLAVGLWWGFWAVADSAQFSTIVTEVADQRFVGTALTVQLALGFVLTVATIWLLPLLEDLVTWRWALLLLVPGPVVGWVAMRRLDAATGPTPTVA